MRPVLEFTKVVATSFYTGPTRSFAVLQRRWPILGLGETRGRGRMDQHHEAHWFAVNGSTFTRSGATGSTDPHKTRRRAGYQG